MKNSKPLLEKDFHFGRLNPRSDYNMYEQFKKSQGKTTFLNAQYLKWKRMLPVKYLMARKKHHVQFKFWMTRFFFFIIFIVNVPGMHTITVALTSLI